MGNQKTIFLKQSEAFLAGEGDRWFERNSLAIENMTDDPVIETMNRAVYLPKTSRIIEVGCSNGHRLRRLKKAYDFWAKHLFGIDPSPNAIANAKLRDGMVPENFQVGTATKLPGRNKYSAIIYGFCLYLCDPEDLSSIVAEADRRLNSGGFIIIHDFITDDPHSVPYKHLDRVFSYKMDHAKLWLANPAYSLITRSTMSDGTAVTILQKHDPKTAFPVRPE